MITKTDNAIQLCTSCRSRRTRLGICTVCARRAAKEERQAAKRRKIVGSAANLGAEAFLAALRTPDGFARTDGQETWPGEPAWPCVSFVGHDGLTTIKVVILDADSRWNPGSGHVDFQTSRGHFCFDRLGVEDSFYVDAEDRVPDVDRKIEAQIIRVLETRARHLTSETVPWVGHVVTPKRKAEIAETLLHGGVHEFRPSGFGTGYRCTTSRRLVGPYAKVAPADFASFFGLTATVYYDTLDCD